MKKKNILTFANPLLDFQEDKEEILSVITSVLESGNYLIGPFLSKFEREFALYNGSRFAVGVNSGTDALRLALLSLGVGANDEVIVPSHTAVATVSAIVSIGAIPVFADINSDDFTLDITSVTKLISKSTKAVVAVHIYGKSCEMEGLVNLCKSHKLKLVEDCAQSAGGNFRGRKLGSIGDIGCFSFYPTKNIGAFGDAGAIITNEERIFSKLLSLRQYGWDKKRISKIPSTVSRLDEIQAAVLSVKLKKLDDNNERRISNATAYYQELENIAEIKIPHLSKNKEHVFHLYVIQTEKRKKLIKAMEKFGIIPGIHYPTPVHQQPAFVQYFDRKAEKLETTEFLCNRILTLPMYPQLTFEEIHRVTGVINSVYSR